MEIYRRKETVITLRATRAFRDAGIRYGMHKTMFIGSAILMVFGLIPLGIGVFNGIDGLVKLMLLGEMSAFTVLLLAHAAVVFPHSPEITEDDVENMAALRIPEAVIRSSLDSSLPVANESTSELENS
ncbi:MAG: hypothetical protein Q8K07_15895 [Methylicorpusculum sp.]|jgi:hypothetical protein|uniref:hypothetical protein n=1 Tax=Methylicorpusculum TaxID=2713642 RepID=UPI0013584076|nr:MULTISPECIES: hypothetical protein [Methylicorpusculum]MCD2452030.1 hypothetical protein [Methylicorpusculum oleiharenae]MDP2203506.1 hypothetical protein [Methylicorpusculum sp.]